MTAPTLAVVESCESTGTPRHLARAALGAANASRRAAHLAAQLAATGVFRAHALPLDAVAKALREDLFEPLVGEMGLSARQSAAVAELLAPPANDAPPEALLELVAALGVQVDGLEALLAARPDLVPHARWCAARLRASVANLALVAIEARVAEGPTC